jgi:hypothetical protein
MGRRDIPYLAMSEQAITILLLKFTLPAILGLDCIQLNLIVTRGSCQYDVHVVRILSAVRMAEVG